MVADKCICDQLSIVVLGNTNTNLLTAIFSYFLNVGIVLDLLVLVLKFH